jgi:hypothetical protein
MWLYRTRSGRWCITLDDPTVLPVTATVGSKGVVAPLSHKERAAMRDKLMRDTGLYRTKNVDVAWPDGNGCGGEGSVVEWEVLKGDSHTLVDHGDSDDDSEWAYEDTDDDDEDTEDDEGRPVATKASSWTKKKSSSSPWQPFDGLQAVQDVDDPRDRRVNSKGGSADVSPTRSPLSASSSKSSCFFFDAAINNTTDPAAGPAGFVMTGITMLVGGRGTFLRLAEHDNIDDKEEVEAEYGHERNVRRSFAGGVSSAKRPLLVHGSPVYKYECRVFS